MKVLNLNKKKRAIAYFCFALFGAAVALALVAKPKRLLNLPTSYVVEDQSGRLLSAAIATDGQWRFPPADSIPYRFQTALICFEDKRFKWHLGVDPLALMRAAHQWLTRGKIVSGASTISMQVMRLNRGEERTIIQKFIEILLATGLELRYSKDDILKFYASNAPFGSNVVGLEAASWRYFGRSPETLSWAESAMLAVLPNAPSLIHPGRNRELLLEKRNRLLEKLKSAGKIDEELLALSKLEPLPEAPHPLPQLAPHLLTHFRQSRNTHSLNRLKSTLDGHLQERIAEILQRHHESNKANGILNAAALVIGVDAGEVLAYVGNISSDDADAEPYVDMIQALRSPGSTLKPFLYAGLLDDGQLLPHTLIADVPTQIGGFTPENFDLNYDGAVPASAALSRSLNVPAIKMLQQYRYPRFYELLKKIGINSLTKNPDHYGLSMILGGGEVSMWELSAAYANLARTLKQYEGKSGLSKQMSYFSPTFYEDIRSSRIAQEKKLSSPPLRPSSIYYTFQAMNEVSRPESEAFWELFSSSRPIAWKTGTSFGFRDAWSVGVTPDYVVCVWVGNADGEGRPGLTGIQRAAPILFEIFATLPEDSDKFPLPLDEMIQTRVCTQSGHLAGEHCTDSEEVYIPASGFKSSVCPYHQVIHTNLEGTFRMNASCAPGLELHTRSWFVLPPLMEHYYKRKNPSYLTLPPYLPGCEPEIQRTMELIYPRNRSKIYIPLELDGQRGKVVFSAAHQQSDARIFWHLNEKFLGETTHLHQIAAEITPGHYNLVLVDQHGNRISQQIEILQKQ